MSHYLEVKQAPWLTRGFVYLCNPLQVREGAIQVLVNLCSGSSATRCALLQQDGAAALLEAASRSLAGLPAAPEAEKGVNYTVPILALTGLTALSADAALAAPLVHQLGAAAPLLQLLLSSGCPPRVRELAAKCVANLSIPDTCKEALVRQGALPLLMLRIRAGVSVCVRTGGRLNTHSSSSWSPPRTLSHCMPLHGYPVACMRIPTIPTNNSIRPLLPPPAAC